MASKCCMLLIIMAITVAIIPSIAFASSQYTVGDDRGWGPKINYTQWAQGKKFVVGDTLVFNYPTAMHNVLNVTGPTFTACEAQEGAAAPLITGNDVVTLATPGRKWYICGFEGHCDGGMKLLIIMNEWSTNSPAPAPYTRTSAAVTTRINAFFALFVAVVSGVIMFKAF